MIVLPPASAREGSVDRTIQLQHLADAERHIADGARHIYEQELRLEFIERRGQIQNWPAPFWKHFACCKSSTSPTAI
jgi:hypothetical protein